MIWLNRSSSSPSKLSMDFRISNLCRTRIFRFPPSIGLTVFIIFLLASAAICRSFLQSIAWDSRQQLGVTAIRPLKGPTNPPVFAYWISGTGGDGGRIIRLLKAVYHPRNHYLLHLDAGATGKERSKMAQLVQKESLFRAFGNVDVVGKGDAVDWTGSSVVAATLHGAAVLLKVSKDWDWFITLSASDYPIVTQDDAEWANGWNDSRMGKEGIVSLLAIPGPYRILQQDLLYAFTALPRDLNFLDHTSDLGWKEEARFDKIIVDPSLYMDSNMKLSYTSETRKTPDAFKIFTGSPWVILSRPFVEHCVHGWDNLPRKLLMYFANVPYAAESYFQTVICNTPEFQNTTINNDLRYFAWDDPPQLEPLFLNQSDYWPMRQSGAAFARKFLEGDPVLKKVDEKILHRSPEGVALGKWCSAPSRKDLKMKDRCSSWGNIDTVKPGPSGKKLRRLVSEIVSKNKLHSNQCKISSAEIQRPPTL